MPSKMCNCLHFAHPRQIGTPHFDRIMSYISSAERARVPTYISPDLAHNVHLIRTGARQSLV